MKVLVYEHVSGGGYAGQPIPASELAEGFGMLRCIVEDFKEAGHEVTVLLDSRISKLNPKIAADCTVPILYQSEPEKFLKDIAQINDATYVIAPETGQTLQSLVELTEKTGKISLNCISASIGAVADKAVLYEKLKKLGFATPKTILINVADDLTEVKQIIKRSLNYPLVFKPVDGVGCSGLSIIREEGQIESSIEKIKTQSNTASFVAQEFISGESASVCLLSTGKKAVALSLNKQNLTLAGPEAVSSYSGGVVPFMHWRKQEAFEVAEKIAQTLSLRGYVGVDFILTEHKAYVVDVNPRLTTSYVGLRKVASFNVAESLLDAVLKETLPVNPEIEGFACFSKIEISKLTMPAFEKTAKISSVVSPPFPFSENDKAFSLVIGEGATLAKATLQLEEAKKRLCTIVS